MTTTRQRILCGTLSLTAIALVVSPAVVSAAASNTNTTVTATVGSSISITSSGTVAISVTPTAGGVVSSAGDTVTVNTNNASGYTLTLSDADTNTNLISGGNNIAAHTGTLASPTTLGNNSWGYRIVNAGGFGATAYSAETNNASSTSTWAGVPSSASPATVKTTGASASNDTTQVWYGLRATSSQPNGAYSDTVTYSATTNP